MQPDLGRIAEFLLSGLLRHLGNTTLRHGHEHDARTRRLAGQFFEVGNISGGLGDGSGLLAIQIADPRYWTSSAGQGHGQGTAHGAGAYHKDRDRHVSSLYSP